MEWRLMGDERITVFLADDNVIVREGVRGVVGARGRPRSRRAPPTTTTASSRVRRRRRPRCSSPTSACPRASSARASTRRRSCASATLVPGSWSSRSTTTPTTPSRSSATVRPATPTSSRTGSARATSSPAPCARLRPAGRCWIRRSSRRWCSRSPTTPGSPRPTSNCSTRSPRATDQGDRQRRRAPPRPRWPIRSKSSSSSCRKARAPARSVRCTRLRMLHTAIVDREEQGERLSRLLPGGLAEKVRNEGRAIGETEELVVTVLMARHPRVLGHRRAQRSHAARGAAQRAPGRDEPRHPRRGRHGDAVRRRRGDGVFGAPVPLDEHADHAVCAASRCSTGSGR